MGIGDSLQKALGRCFFKIYLTLIVAFACFLSSSFYGRCTIAEQTGHTAAFIPSAHHALQMRLNLIESSKKNLNLSYFIFADDFSGLSTILALRKAAQNGVKIRIIVDGLYRRISKDMLAYLQHQNIEIRCFHKFRLNMPVQWLFKRLHLKITTSDDHLAILGSRNIDDTYFSQDSFRKKTDEEVLIDSKTTIKALNDYFDLLWESKHLQTPPKKKLSQKKLNAIVKLLDETEIKLKVLRGFFERNLVNAPLHFFDVKNIQLVANDWDIINEKVPEIPYQYKKLFETAEKEMLLMSPYFVLTPDIKKLILDARARGVAVHIITNSRWSNDQPLSQEMFEIEKYDLLKTGVKIWEMRGPTSIHSKSIVVDSRYIYFGSQNLNARSQYFDIELGAIVDDPQFAASFKHHIYERYGPLSKPVEIEQQVPHPFATRCKNLLIRTTSRMIRSHI